MEDILDVLEGAEVEFLQLWLLPHFVLEVLQLLLILYQIVECPVLVD